MHPNGALFHYSQFVPGREYYRVGFDGGISVFFFRSLRAFQNMSGDQVNGTNVRYVHRDGYDDDTVHQTYFSLLDMHVQSRTDNTVNTYNNHYVFANAEDAINYVVQEYGPIDNWRQFISLVSAIVEYSGKTPTFVIPEWVVDYAQRLYEYDMNMLRRKRLMEEEKHLLDLLEPLTAEINSIDITPPTA